MQQPCASKVNEFQNTKQAFSASNLISTLICLQIGGGSGWAMQGTRLLKSAPSTALQIAIHRAAVELMTRILVIHNGF